MNAVEFLVSHNAKAKRSTVLNVKLKDQVKGVQTQAPDPIRQESLVWRGHGGRHPTHSSVAFDRQLDKVSIWLEQWDHDTKCAVLEAILRHSGYKQFQFLATVLQPSLHRDFMYAASIRFPDIDFKPISTHVSRELKARSRSKVEKHRLARSLIGSCSTLSVGSEGFLTDRFYPDTTRSVQPESVSTRGAVARRFTKLLSLISQSTWSSRDAEIPEEGMQLLKWYTNSWNGVQVLAEVGQPQQPVGGQVQRGQVESTDIGRPHLEASVSGQPQPPSELEQWYLPHHRFQRPHAKRADGDLRQIPDRQRQRRQDDSGVGHPDRTAAARAQGHTKGVWCLQFFTKHLLVSGSFDSTIKVWNLRTGNTSRTLLSHSGPVWALARHGNLLASVSQDRTAKVWNINRCRLLHTLTGHNAAIFSVDMNESGSTVITGSADRSVRLWSVETGKCQKVIWVSPSTSIMALSYSQGYFACSYGNTICLYRGTKLVKTFNEHYKRVETLQLRIVDAETGEGMLVSGGQDSMVKYWDVSKRRMPGRSSRDADNNHGYCSDNEDSNGDDG
ncbi:hypothetical protein C0Q70_11099 [Pomacea canaliculata]|uniref:Uncharacterized protein n=1 Tax=Pomacea canaliculata TaxID=400727 RepID=A0A2T7P525_POMCA|nr:hypothetical protein C0Q70_11099 [Pomacea canaliculata]